MVHQFWNLYLEVLSQIIVTICFIYVSGFHSFILTKVISFVSDGFSYFMLIEHSLLVAGHSC